MAVLPILELPHAALRKKARKVKKIDSSILRLAYDMVDTMREAGGTGLAANQVGVLRRVIVVQLPAEAPEIEGSEVEEEEARIYINPEIVHREGERRVEEGCLSIPGYKGFITRSVWVKFRALDHTSKTVKLKADELLAQVLEHEVDHLNGILYIDHLESHEKLLKVEPETQLEPTDASQQVTEPTPESSEHHLDGAEELVGKESDPRETPASLKVR